MGDVDWHATEDYTFASVGDDKKLMMYVVRRAYLLRDRFNNHILVGTLATLQNRPHKSKPTIARSSQSRLLSTSTSPT